MYGVEVESARTKIIHVVVSEGEGPSFLRCVKEWWTERVVGEGKLGVESERLVVVDVAGKYGESVDF
jgi:hypothetical protein